MGETVDALLPSLLEELAGLLEEGGGEGEEGEEGEICHR